MPPTELLTIGPVHILAVNQIYAMPGRKVTGFITPDTAVVEAGNLPDMSDAQQFSTTLTEGQFTSSAAFLRVTSGAADLRLVAD